MTTKAPTAAKTADPKKDQAPAGQTPSLPLKGGKEGTTKGLDNKTVIKSPPDPKVLTAAEKYADCLGAINGLNKKATELGEALLAAFDASKKERRIRIVRDAQTFTFYPGNIRKLIVEKKKAVN